MAKPVFNTCQNPIRGLGSGKRLEGEAAAVDELVDEIVETIRQAAHTGLRGDGKIYVLSRVEDAVRISTGERGETAV